MDRLRAIQAAILEVEAAWPDDSTAVGRSLAAGVVRGKTVPADLGRKLLRAEDAYEAAEAQLHVLRLAEGTAAGELRNIFDDAATDIVTGHLRPAMAEILATVAELVPKLKGVSDPDALVKLQDTAALKAWGELEVAATRFRQIRGAYEIVYQAVFQDETDISALDVRAELAYANWYELARNPDRSIATPTHLTEYLVWLMTSEPRPQPWLPLPTELTGALVAQKERAKEMAVAAYTAGRERVGAARQRERDEQEERDQASDKLAPWKRG